MVMKLREEQKYGRVGFGERGGKEREKRGVNTRDAYRYIYTHTQANIHDAFRKSLSLAHAHTQSMHRHTNKFTVSLNINCRYVP